MEIIMLDERIKKDLTDRYQAMQDRVELFSKTQLDAYYTTLRCRFGPEVLVADLGQGAPAREDPDLRWLHGEKRFWELVRGRTD
jgi:hypothetical protein